MQTERQYIDREEALDAIKAYAEERDDERKTSPAWTASQIAAIIEGLETKAMGKGIYEAGEIKASFIGINLSMGRCPKCDHALIWYTEDPIVGCPYCFLRRRRPRFIEGGKR